MLEKEEIFAVVVTYNRKVTLLQCLRAIEAQTLKPKCVFILDNASTDGTQETLSSFGYINSERNDITFHYILNGKNEGGAGGFYRGMKSANDYGEYDALWVMDDDGLPDKDCLKNMISYLGKYDYISPLVVDINNEQMMSFEGCTVSEFLKRANNGTIAGCANPFNGILYSKRLIETVGYPKKEMFIWGDEINYDLRAKKAGFHPIMVANAIHRHPLNRQMYVQYFRNHSMVASDKDWKLFCYLRNRTYNSRTFDGIKQCFFQMVSDIAKFALYYVFKQHQPSKLKLVVKAVSKGFRGDFTGMDKYFK